MKAIVGAVLIDGLGGPPLSDSVVVTAADRIREAGPRSTVLIPAEADKVDGSGKWVVPAPIDISHQKSRAVYLTTPDKTAMEAARDAGNPIVGHISKQADVRAFVAGGATAFIGMITDTEDLDHDLVAQLRNLRIVVAPALVSQGAALEIAKRNTKRLFTAGVPIAMASNGGDAAREPELLADAGIPALDVIAAITHNSAAALGILKDTGTIEGGKQADLLVLAANPGEDIHNLAKVALRMSAGGWVK